MSTEFHNTAILPISIDKFVQTICDKNYWEQRAKVNSENGKLNHFENQGNKITVSSTTFVPAADLPAPLQAAKPEGLFIARLEHWEIGTDVLLADFQLQVEDAPAHLSGNSRISPENSDSSKIELSGKAEVKIPVFGKKIEQGIIESIGSLLDTEREFTVTWVNGIA